MFPQLKDLYCASNFSAAACTTFYSKSLHRWVEKIIQHHGPYHGKLTGVAGYWVESPVTRIRKNLTESRKTRKTSLAPSRLTFDLLSFSSRPPFSAVQVPMLFSIYVILFSIFSIFVIGVSSIWIKSYLYTCVLLIFRHRLMSIFFYCAFVSSSSLVYFRCARAGPSLSLVYSRCSCAGPSLSRAGPFPSLFLSLRMVERLDWSAELSPSAFYWH